MKRRTAMERIAQDAYTIALARAMAVDRIQAPRWLCNLLTRSIFEAISKDVAAGKRVSVSGFGTFARREMSARTVVTPSGRAVEVPARWAMVFRASKRQKGVL